jgi:hypothetical protein
MLAVITGASAGIGQHSPEGSVRADMISSWLPVAKSGCGPSPKKLPR